MDGVAEYSDWQRPAILIFCLLQILRVTRIFIIEPSFTPVIAIVFRSFIVDWAETAKFLIVDEKQLLVTRLSANNEEAKISRLDNSAFYRIFFDPKMYIANLV